MADSLRPMQRPAEVAARRDDADDRPVFSVMIPAHRPNHYLFEALRSVLAAGYDTSVMQVEVLIDGPVEDEYLGALHSVAADRVSVFLHGRTVGQAHNLNTAIAHARGEFLHILHHDDLVLPGFYEAVQQGFAAADSIGAVFTRHAFIDEDGHWQEISHLERKSAGMLAEWLSRLAIYCRIQTPSIVVRRSVYEQIGGFREDLIFALDWEMWVRIARHYDFWFDPRILALYRVTEAGVSGSMRRSAADMRDVAKAIDVMGGYLPTEIRAHARRAALESHACGALNMARTMYLRGDPEAAAKQMRAALAMSWSPLTLATAARVLCGQVRRRVAGHRPVNSPARS